MKTQTLTIQGMSCNHCVMHVRKELSKVATVKDVQIGKAVVEIDESATTHADLSNAVAEAGYSVTSIS